MMHVILDSAYLLACKLFSVYGNCTAANSLVAVLPMGVNMPTLISYSVRTDRLREAAAAQGDHTGQAIHRTTGVSAGVISRTLNGRTVPSLNTLMRLGTPYGLSLNDLIGDAR
ncbi:helix-turn-helix domain-containing protein [Embleya sp. NPDC127516]|uniref:helix-turn-helix domain-containing protein n=1 Tax=Embleya sp. NPDC127516 TaxID=3363990 RepID=UPI00382F9CDA